MIILSCKHLQMQREAFSFSECLYLPKGRSSKSKSIVQGPVPGSFINEGRLILVTGKETRSWHHTQTDCVTSVASNLLFSGPTCFLTVTWKKSESISHPVVSNSLQPQGLKPARLLCPDFLGKNTWEGCHFLRQGIKSPPGIKPGFPAVQAESLPSEPSGKPRKNLLSLNTPISPLPVPVEAEQVWGAPQHRRLSVPLFLFAGSR